MLPKIKSLFITVRNEANERIGVYFGPSLEHFDLGYH